MNYLLDTDTTSYLIKRKSQQHQIVLKHLLSKSPENVAISSITVAELASGINQIPDTNQNHKKQIQEAFEHFFTSIHVLDYTFASAIVYGKLRAFLKTNGNDIGPMDCLIAAHALSEGYVLVTNNTKHFKRIKNLELENWTV